MPMWARVFHKIMSLHLSSHPISQFYSDSVLVMHIACLKRSVHKVRDFAIHPVYKNKSSADVTIETLPTIVDVSLDII